MSNRGERGASSSDQWLNCHGSPEMSLGETRVTRREAAEGRAAHKLAEECLLDGRNAFDRLGTVYPQKCEGKLVDFIVDADMAEAVQLYLNSVREQAAGSVLAVEKRIPLDYIGEKTVVVIDVSFLHGTTLNVWDYKHGKGRLVEVATDTQLILGAIAAWIEACAAGHKIDHVAVTICQPRIPHKDGPVRRHSYSVEELQTWLDYVVEAARAEFNLVAGPHCYNCLAAYRCRPRIQRTIELSASVRPMHEMADDELCVIMDELPTLKRNLDQIHDHVGHLLSIGRIELKNWKLVESAPRAKCENHERLYDVVALLGLDPEKFKKPVAPISLTEAKKKAGKNVAPLVAKLYTRPAPGLTIAPMGDKRPAVAPKHENMFNGVNVAPPANIGE